jgi:class 3 adenylate cyclase/tetratricopeptide (TPR) repeat protein
VSVCPGCGEQLPGEFRFCPFCGVTLAEAAGPAPALQERKVVSVLFCDLVGFTAASEQTDPEDVQARLDPYHARVRAEIERFGGTVEKYVGDAVMAIFGIPAAHEDDAERAVRTGLRILDVIDELNAADPALELAVRIGVNTGEALVTLWARADTRQWMVSGDVTNTASRLQSAAPVGAAVVGEATFRQTRAIFEFEELPPVELRGKAERVPIWRALAARARFGSDLLRTDEAPFVGREVEQRLLQGLFDRCARDSSAHLVTLVGEPGVGKSRVVGEFFAHLEARPGTVTWRQGRCLPYGEGITFWALGEILKTHAGIYESDSAADAAAKLEAVLPDADDRPWLRARLLPLLGIESIPAEQQESFAAWRRFCESLASERPAVLVFEDLHWADDALLSFIEHVADWSQGVPLLLICTARPELFEQHPYFGADARNAQRINLAPLSDEETARLISALLERAALPAEMQRVLLERAGGNPLYAEEFVRLTDRDLLSGAIEDVPFPDSVQALIAARLDTLSPERKGLLQDAAVVGKVFWAGAVAEMGGRDPRDVELALHELARKELVRPARTSSMEGEAEHSFWHLLVQDVCYAQIPRAARASRHRAAAAWIERKAGERVEDLADVLAHHYLAALELARASGQEAETEEIEAGAIRYLALAGERALALDVASAEASLARALALAPAGHPQNGSLLERWAQAAQQQGRLQEARAALEETLAHYREHAEPPAAGRALTALSTVLLHLGDPRAEQAIAEALVLLEAQPPGPELVAAYAELAAMRVVFEACPEAIGAAEQALRLASGLGLAVPARALGYRGHARALLGEREGLDDMQRALALAVEQGDGRGAAILHNNLAFDAWPYDGPQAALERCREGIDFCERRGIAETALEIAGMSLTFLVETGRGERALAAAEPLVQQAEAAGVRRHGFEPRSVQLRLLAQRDEGRQSIAEAERLAASARETGEPQVLALAFASAAQLLAAHGRPQQAMALLCELERTPGIRGDPYYASLLPELVRCALTLEDPELGARLADGVEPRTPLHEHALRSCRAQLAEAAGHHGEAATRYAEAAERWRAFGNEPERAHALLGQGRCLTQLANPTADQSLRQARALFTDIGAQSGVAECDTLIVHGARSVRY